MIFHILKESFSNNFVYKCHYMTYENVTFLQPWTPSPKKSKNPYFARINEKKNGERK